MKRWDSIVIGAGQAGLSSSFHLGRLGIEHLVLDRETAPGGAWQHRWDELRMADVHGVADLPEARRPASVGPEPANEAIPRYFADYERTHHVPVVRPVRVTRVSDLGEDLLVEAGDQTWRTGTLINATGTWRHPFLPWLPGIHDFTGEQFHTATYPGTEHFRGRRVMVVGGGASAVQFLGSLRLVADTVWVTRRPPVWRDSPFDSEAGREAVDQVSQRVRLGLPPRSVVSVTGLALRPQEQLAAQLGAYHRLPLPARVLPEGAVWPDGRVEAFDAILWATGFRPDIAHLADLGLKSAAGGIRLGDTPASQTTAVADPRIQLVGYGPSASTIGASRAGRVAALAVRRRLASGALAGTMPT